MNSAEPGHRPEDLRGAGRWWACPPAAALRALDSSATGLATPQVDARLRRDGPNRLPEQPNRVFLQRLAARLLDPLMLVLLAASAVAGLTGDVVSFVVVTSVVAISVTLDLLQEHRAGDAARALRERIALRVRALRDGAPCEVLAEAVVAGDVIELRAGDRVPADGLVLMDADCFVDQAALTGEAYPVRKSAADAAGPPADAPLEAAGTLFQGSNLVSGSTRMLVCATGPRTMLGGLAGAATAAPPPTAFEHETRRFGMMLTRVTMVMVLGVLLVNLVSGRPLLESFLFALALAVGLTPELLPMIVSVTLAHGAIRMAERQTIVKRLSAVHDLGAIDVLCTDKTGTLTEARMNVALTLDGLGGDGSSAFELAWLNSRFQTGTLSPLDDAILARSQRACDDWRKLDEVPFDFERKRVSVLLARGDQRLLVVKGAPESVLGQCAWFGSVQAPQPLNAALRTRIDQAFEQCSAQGLRLLAVACRATGGVEDVTVADERDLVFAGFVAFDDPPKATAGPTLTRLADNGVAVKIVSGDHEAVNRHLCAQVGLPVLGVLTGPQIDDMDDGALRAAMARTNLFCRVTPQQKRRIVQTLQHCGRTVGYLGDGINDAPALRCADVGISVEGAVDVARESADLILLQRDLGVLCDGVREGRRAVMNVRKYLRMATSSNFGNMASMAVSSLFLPFLPMRPAQILLNNLLYDVSELAIPSDRVADESLRSAQRWDLTALRRFMFSFGPLSSLFDLLTFALLLGVFRVTETQFQTAWFIESTLTQVLVVFVIRTALPPWRDRPGLFLACTSLAVVLAALVVATTPMGRLFGFVPLPAVVFAALAGVTLAYLGCAEWLKRRISDRDSEASHERDRGGQRPLSAPGQTGLL